MTTRIVKDRHGREVAEVTTDGGRQRITQYGRFVSNKRGTVKPLESGIGYLYYAREVVDGRLVVSHRGVSRTVIGAIDALLFNCVNICDTLIYPEE